MIFMHKIDPWFGQNLVWPQIQLGYGDKKTNFVIILRKQAAIYLICHWNGGIRTHDIF